MNMIEDATSAKTEAFRARLAAELFRMMFLADTEGVLFHDVLDEALEDAEELFLLGVDPTASRGGQGDTALPGASTHGHSAHAPADSLPPTNPEPLTPNP